MDTVSNSYMKQQYLIEKARQKALKSKCNYKIAALGFNHKGEMIGSAFNKPRFERHGGGLHAEMNVMLKSGPSLKTIIICRVNKHGKFLPIHPCTTCRTKAKELDIKIVTINELID
jgi:cytidine deaminase